MFRRLALYLYCPILQIWLCSDYEQNMVFINKLRVRTLSYVIYTSISESKKMYVTILLRKQNVLINRISVQELKDRHDITVYFCV